MKPNEPKPNAQVAARIEELLREQLEEMAVTTKILRTNRRRHQLAHVYQRR